MMRHLAPLLIAVVLASCTERSVTPPDESGVRASSSNPPADQTPAPATAPSAPDGFVRVANARCPVQTEHPIRNGMVLRELAVEHRGKWIGMCCGDCIDYWRNLSDQERDELLAAAMTTDP